METGIAAQAEKHSDGRIPVSNSYADTPRVQAMSEQYVTRERLAEIMGVSARTIDRLVVVGMPSQTWGIRTRRFLPSQAVKWAAQRQDLGE